MNKDLNLFLQLWTGGFDVPDTESQRLLNRLRDDSEFRSECVAEMKVLGMCKAVQSSSPRWLELNEVLGIEDVARYSGTADFSLDVMEQIVRQSRGQRRGMSWLGRPAWAVAAGLMVGLFSASMVWAYAVPFAKRVMQIKLEAFSDSFEDSSATWAQRFPKAANEWSGDLSRPLTAENGVQPVKGDYMVRLSPVPGRRLSYARRILDLAEQSPLANGQSIQLEVTASFNSPATDRQVQYQIRLAAFSQEPADVRPIWNNELVLFDTVLQHVGRNLVVEPGDNGWQKLRATLEIPPGTRSLVISLGAGMADDAAPRIGHYLDNVRTRFVVAESPLF